MLAPALALAAALAADPTIRISPGTQEVIRQPGLVRVAITNDDVADVRVTGRDEVLIQGRQRGKTSLTLWAGGRTITRTIVVDDGNATEIGRLVRDTVNPALRVEAYGDRIVVDGVLDSVDELRRLEKLFEGNGNVRILAKVNPRVLPLLAERITQALAKAGMPNARATVVGQKLFLEGSVADPAEREKAQTIADAYYSGMAGW